MRFVPGSSSVHPNRASHILGRAAVLPRRPMAFAPSRDGSPGRTRTSRTYRSIPLSQKSLQCILSMVNYRQSLDQWIRGQSRFTTVCTFAYCLILHRVGSPISCTVGDNSWCLPRCRNNRSVQFEKAIQRAQCEVRASTRHSLRVALLRVLKQSVNRTASLRADSESKVPACAIRVMAILIGHSPVVNLCRARRLHAEPLINVARAF